MSEEESSSASGNACSASPSHQQLTEEWRGLSGGNSSAGCRSGGGPRSLLLKRSENGFGFTLRHFIVYPPESYTVLVPGCRSGCQPMDTMFVKSVRPNSPAARAGLQTGDRVVSVNGQTVTGALTYAHVVHMISQSPHHLHLLVVPRQDDLLQLYFGDTAHNPETNPRVRLRPSVGEAGGGAVVVGGGGGGVSSPPNRQRRAPLLAHHQSVPPLTPPLHTRAAGGSSSRLSTSECSSLDVAVGGGVRGGGGGGGGEWRRASDGGGGAGGGGGEDSSCCSAGSSLDSMSRADFHSSDDSLIIDRIRKSFEQKEEFLRRPVVAAVSPRAPPAGGGAAPIQWPAAIPASCVNPPPAQAQQVVSWRTPPVASNAAAALQVAAVTPSRSKHLTRIDEASSGTGCSARLGGGGGGLVPVAARAQVFEEGAAGQAGVQLFRSELAGLSEKRSAPDVALRRRQFEAGTAKNQNGGDERRVVGGGRGGGGLSRSLDMPCAAMSGNRTTPVGGSRLHCLPPSSSPTPQGLVTSNSSSNIGEAATSWLEEEEWVTTSSSSPPPTTQPRHKAVRQDSYLAACHKPQTQATTDTKDDSIKQSPTEDLQQNSDVDQSHQKRVSYLKQIWTENANRTSPTPPASSQLSERLKKKKEAEEEGPIVVVEGSLLCCTVSSRVASRVVASSGQHWKPVWAVLRGPVLHLMRLKQAESPGPGVDQLADREQWLREDLLARGALIDQCALDTTSSKRSRQAISVQLALDQQAASAGDQQLEGTSADQLILLQASDAISHQQWLRALLNVVEKQRKSSGEEPAQPQAQVPCQQPQQQLPSPKCKTWKGRVAKQFRRIGQGGGGGSSPISPTAPPTAASYQEGASIGVPLDWCPQSQTHEGVPLLVEVCCGEVEARGLEVVGVYRVPGNTAAVTALTEQVNRASGGDVIAQLVAQADVNVVSSLLKSLFRRLPDALLTSDLYPLFIAADKIADPLLRAATIRKLVHSLPDHHFETLRFVMAHLQRVVGRCAVNKMEPRNLAIVFGPTLVRPTADDSCSMLTLVTDMSHQCRIVETLILHADWCFSDDDIDRLQLTTSGGGSEATPPLPPTTSEHMSDNHSLLLENIHKVQGMKSGDLSGSGSGTNLVSAKDIVVSIIGAANRKMHKSKLSRGTGSKQSSQSVAAQSREEDGSRGVAASIRESVLFSGSILAASSHRSHGKKSNDGVDGGGGGGEERSRSQDQDQDEEDEASLTAAVVDKDGMIRTYTGLSACKQERIRRFEQETKAMLQRENAARLSGGGVGLGLEERSKRELDYTDAAGTAESPPSGEDLLSSLTSTFDAKLRSLLSSTSSVEAAAAALMTSGDVTSSQVTSSEEGGEPVAAAFRDPSLHRSTSTTSAASSSCSGQFYQLNRANSAACESTLKQQESVNEAEEEQQSVLVENKKKKKKRDEGEEEEEGEEKKDDSLATKDPLSCKEEEEEELTKKDVEPIASLKTAAAEATKTPASEAAAAAAAVCKVRRSESLEKRALKNADDLLTAGDCKISRRSSLKRSDSLTKSEKTESNLYRRRQQASQQASKRKNGLGGDAVSSGGAGKCAIKRRHTVGGTKDFGGGSDATYNRRTSSPDLSRAARACWEGAAAPFTPPTAPLESHV